MTEGSAVVSTTYLRQKGVRLPVLPTSLYLRQKGVRLSVLPTYDRRECGCQYLPLPVLPTRLYLRQKGVRLPVFTVASTTYQAVLTTEGSAVASLQVVLVGSGSPAGSNSVRVQSQVAAVVSGTRQTAAILHVQGQGLALWPSFVIFKGREGRGGLGVGVGVGEGSGAVRRTWNATCAVCWLIA